MTDEHDLPPFDPDEAPADDDRGLVWEWRVFAVALAWAIPGVVLGALIGLMLPTAYGPICLVAGGLLGFAAGGLLEAEYWG